MASGEDNSPISLPVKSRSVECIGYDVRCSADAPEQCPDGRIYDGADVGDQVEPTGSVTSWPEFLVALCTQLPYCERSNHASRNGTGVRMRAASGASRSSII